MSELAIKHPPLGIELKSSPETVQVSPAQISRQTMSLIVCSSNSDNDSKPERETPRKFAALLPTKWWAPHFWTRMGQRKRKPNSPKRKPCLNFWLQGANFGRVAFHQTSFQPPFGTELRIHQKRFRMAQSKYRADKTKPLIIVAARSTQN